MANNPRKFSEKIALLNQKEQEGNAEFEKIMREVSNATSKEEAAAASALAGLLTTPGYSNDINKSTNERSGSVGPQDNKDLIKFPATNARESRGRSVGGGPMRSRSRNIDTSPYSSNNNAYLSPPTDSSWRRTSSDSAIHQSLTQAQHSHSQQNMTMLNQHSLMQQTLNQQHLQMNNLQQDMKSRSVSRLPGISIYPSGNDDTLQIPIGNSTGSLPDLTLVHFQSPLSTPLDLEHDHQLTDTSYSMSMASTNQTTNQLTNMGIYNNLDYSPKHYGTKASSSQVGNIFLNHTYNIYMILCLQGIQSENNSYNQQQQTAPITIDQQQRHHQQQQQHQQHSPNHQSYPINQMNEKLMSYRNTASPTNLSSSQGNLSKNSYRSTHNRPSPGSSPGVPGLTTNFDSNSSAPPNNQNHCPNNANINSNNNINNNQHHQHHQQQHSPMNNDSLIGNNGYNSFNAALEAALHENGVNDILLGGGMGSDSNSKLITSSSAALQTSISMMTSHPSPQHLISTQTTTSIPEIIFSDYSSGSTDFARDIFCNEFELGSTELQMFENANIIADPTIEDSFRRDLY
ncbi:unnamed protein product [Diamesa serratosioi]